MLESAHCSGSTLWEAQDAGRRCTCSIARIQLSPRRRLRRLQTAFYQSVGASQEVSAPKTTGASSTAWRVSERSSHSRYIRIYRSYQVADITLIGHNGDMNTTQDHRIEPSEVSPDILRQIEALVLDRRRPVLVGSDGERIELPTALNDLLLFVVEAMKRNQAIFLMPDDEAFTTQTAAHFLGMSRPYLMRLLDAGKIPFHFVGTHRRVMLRDLRAFLETRDAERRVRMEALTKAVGDAGVYDRA